jgi:hypothetical protein
MFGQGVADTTESYTGAAPKATWSAFGRRRSWPRPLLDRPSSHDALEILMRDPAAEFSGPYPNRRRPSQLDQLGVPVPAPDRHGGDAKLFLHGLDEGGVGGRGAAPFLERGTTPINRISTFCCPCGGAPVATPLNMKPAPRLGEAGGAESQGARSPGGGDGGGRANAATLYSPRAATKWWAGPQGS